MSADAFFQRVWYRRSPRLLMLLLVPLSWLFGVIAAGRRLAFRSGLSGSVRVGRPVIVVGNISVGGTGKTPVVIWLAERLRAQGRRPGIISRGYGGRATAWPCDVVPASDPSEVGDEAVLLAQRCGGIVVAGPDRVAAANRAIERGADVIVTDDGLQHYRLVRDCELAVVDGGRGLGNGRLLPAGPLREPASRLRNVDAVLLKDAKGGPIAGFEGPAPVIPFSIAATTVTSLHSGEQRLLASFRGQPVHAVAGIGNPQAFFATLRGAGLIVMPHALPDHARIGAADLAFGDAAPVLMTEKDAVKCRAFADARLWSVAAGIEIAAAQAALLLSVVDAALARHGSPTS